MVKATPNKKYVVTKDAKMKHLWPHLRGIKCSQLRNVLLLCQWHKNKPKHEDINQFANTNHAGYPVWIIHPTSFNSKFNRTSSGLAIMFQKHTVMFEVRKHVLYSFPHLYRQGWKTTRVCSPEQPQLSSWHLYAVYIHHVTEFINIIHTLQNQAFRRHRKCIIYTASCLEMELLSSL
jgi:hypothetical protein